MISLLEETGLLKGPFWAEQALHGRRGRGVRSPGGQAFPARVASQLYPAPGLGILGRASGEEGCRGLWRSGERLVRPAGVLVSKLGGGNCPRGGRGVWGPQLAEAERSPSIPSLKPPGSLLWMNVFVFVEIEA